MNIERKQWYKYEFQFHSVKCKLFTFRAVITIIITIARLNRIVQILIRQANDPIMIIVKWHSTRLYVSFLYKLLIY